MYFKCISILNVHVFYVRNLNLIVYVFYYKPSTHVTVLGHKSR